MGSGIWSAVSGAASRAEVLEIVANNLANVDTPAFKKSTPTFKECLISASQPKLASDIPRNLVQNQDFYFLEGRDSAQVVLDETVMNHSQGPIKRTENRFDLALEGPGFFELATPEGIRFTRSGPFKLNSEGILIHSSGFPVLSKRDPAVTSENPGSSELSDRLIRLKLENDAVGNVAFTINRLGEIYSKDQFIGQLQISELKNLKHLRPIGQGMYQGESLEALDAVRTTVHQGALEVSNVNPIEEMMRMIQANRLFEADLRSLKTYHDMMGKEANEVGKL